MQPLRGTTRRDKNVGKQRAWKPQNDKIDKVQIPQPRRPRYGCVEVGLRVTLTLTFSGDNVCERGSAGKRRQHPEHRNWGGGGEGGDGDIDTVKSPDSRREISSTMMSPRVLAWAWVWVWVWIYARVEGNENVNERHGRRDVVKLKGSESRRERKLKRHEKARKRKATRERM